MTRQEEYRALLEELDSVPDGLQTVAQQALKRGKAYHRRGRAAAGAGGSLAACFLAFILLVNLIPTFAAACGRVPVLRELAKAVAWSPSLSAAVENGYVQPIGQSQTENGVTATVEYLIVDQKQLNIYYTLKPQDKKAHPQLEAEAQANLPDGSGGFSTGSSSFGTPNGELREVRLDFVDGEMPAALDLTLRVYDGHDPDAPAEPAGDLYDGLLTGVEREPERAYLAEFTFPLAFDPYFTDRGRVVEVNRTFLLDGQSVTVTTAQVYPTHLRVDFDYGPDNTAWLEGLDFYLENEDGDQFRPPANGITATGSPDGKGLASFWADSPWFSKGERLTLHITGASWLDKAQERVRVDLENAAGEGLPEGVQIEWTERREDGWLVCTSHPRRWDSGTMFPAWGGTFYGPGGEEHSIGAWTAQWGPSARGELSGAALEAFEAEQEANRDRIYETFGLSGYAGDEVWLCPAWTRNTAYEAPVSVPLYE